MNKLKIIERQQVELLDGTMRRLVSHPGLQVGVTGLLIQEKIDIQRKKILNFKFNNLVPNNNAWGSKKFKEPGSLDKAVDDTVSNPVFSEGFEIDGIPVIEYIKDKTKKFFKLKK